MTVATQDCAAQAARFEKASHGQRVAWGRRLQRLLPLASLCLFLLPALCALPQSAQAETTHVKATADAGLPQVQARQQALDRALAEAVFAEARRMLGPVPEPRLDALRAYLTPQALDFVLTYQEVHAAKAPLDAQQVPQQFGQQVGQQEAQPGQHTSPGQAPPAAAHATAAGPLVFEADVEVNRTHLRNTLVRLGFFSEVPAPLIFSLRLGHGVTEADAKGLDSLNVLLGLARGQQNAAAPASPMALPEIVLERLPQGYYKAVLRQGQSALAVDAASLSALWLNLWGKHFAQAQRQAGPGMQRLNISGFAGVDAALELLQAMMGWEEAVQEPKLALLELAGAEVRAQYVCRVINQKALDARLAEALAARKLGLLGQTGAGGPALPTGATGATGLALP